MPEKGFGVWEIRHGRKKKKQRKRNTWGDRKARDFGKEQSLLTG